MIGVAVKPSDGVRMIGSTHDAELHKRVQRSIDCGPGNSRNTVFNVCKELIRGGMVVAVQHGLEDNAPLYSLRQSLSATKFLEPRDLLLFKLQSFSIHV